MQLTVMSVPDSEMPSGHDWVLVASECQPPTAFVAASAAHRLSVWYEVARASRKAA